MLEAIRNRHSIRKYTGAPVSRDQIEGLLRSAMQAPSARNLQPWHFTVITCRDTLARVPEVHPYASMVPGAGAAILVSGDTHVQPLPGYLAQDCSAAVTNLLLEAVDTGLGAVWLGVYPRDERIQGIRELLSLPEHLLPIALISLGVPGEDKGFQDRYDPSRIHWITDGEAVR